MSEVGFGQAVDKFLARHGRADEVRRPRLRELKGTALATSCGQFVSARTNRSASARKPLRASGDDLQSVWILSGATVQSRGLPISRHALRGTLRSAACLGSASAYVVLHLVCRMWLTLIVKARQALLGGDAYRTRMG
jgi:hypothetical protein